MAATWHRSRDGRPPTGAPGGSTATGASTSVTTYAANGSTQSLDLSFEQDTTLPGTAPKGAVSAWTVEGVLADPGGTPDYTNATTSTLYFDQSGNLVGYTDQKGTTSASGTSFSLTVPGRNDRGGLLEPPRPSRCSVPSVTANSSADTVSVLSQDGNAPGTLQSYSIGNTGLIQGVFSNGQTLNLGQIALATFSNPDGLLRAGRHQLRSPPPTPALPQVGAPGNGSFGTIQAGTLEASNVDLATEMTELIEAQNGFRGQRERHLHLQHLAAGPRQPEERRLITQR